MIQRPLFTLLSAVFLFTIFFYSPLTLSENPPANASPTPSPSYTGPPEGLLSRLLAPGKLIEGHQKLEHTDCLKCHIPRQGIPDEKCLDCHKEIRSFIEGKTGFHGRQDKRCYQCHNDHKGREHDTTKINQKIYDHKLTGYSLAGKHSKLKCVQCHVEKRASAKKKLRPNEPRYLGLKTTCVHCHKKHDVHFFLEKHATKDCNVCHGSESWKTQIKFNHETEGKYKLIGRHATLKCAKCHVPKPNQPIYKWPELQQKQCETCHKNPHENKIQEKYFQKSCLGCHTLTPFNLQQKNAWNIPQYDHAITQYPLKGKHAQIKCIACHKQTPLTMKTGPKAFQWKGLKTDCLSCHKNIHRNEGMNQCSRCHTETNWKTIIKFNHDQTRYPLVGKHVKTPCIKCHVTVNNTPNTKQVGPQDPKTPRIYRWTDFLEQGCRLCHKSPHDKFFSPKTKALACDACHNNESWKTIIAEPLNTPAANPNSQVFELTPPLQPSATQKLPIAHRFNHTRDTRYSPQGTKHLQKKCKDCHQSEQHQIYQFPSHEKGFCKDCHKTPHQAQFSHHWLNAPCTTCHTLENFTQRLDFDHSKTEYKLTGKHAKTPCQKCHVFTKDFLLLPDKLPPGRPPSETPMSAQKFKSKFLFPEIATLNCAACHKDVHKGKFGPKCSDCHGDRGWKMTIDFHKGFTLSGVHYTLECEECHTQGRRLGGMSENCYGCHGKDDIHGGALPRCGACHSQHFWDVSEFRHSLTEFPLRGVHRSLDCHSCHQGGIYKGAPTRCMSCHYKDVAPILNHPTHPHSGFLNEECSNCHNQFSFTRGS